MGAVRAEYNDVVIVGGGICGLATALALHRKGIKSLVLERAESLRATGTALGVQANGWRAIDQLGIGSELRQTSLPLKRFRDVSTSNVTLQEHPLGTEYRYLKRSVLLETLANALPRETIRFGCQLLAIQLDPITKFPILQLHDGSVIKAKVVIGCDGVNSVIADFMKLRPPKFTSNCSARGFTFYLDGHGFPNDFVSVMASHAWLGRVPIDENRVFWFVSRRATSEDLTISKDPELIRQSATKSITGFPSEMVDMIKNSGPDSLNMTIPRYRAPWEVLLGNFRKGVVTVAGDAMHVMGPFLGQGGSAALEDAIVLARWLAPELGKSENGMFSMEKIGAAMDGYVKERRMRLVALSPRTFIIGILSQKPSMLVRFICILVMMLFFRDRAGHTRYDCGRL